MFKISSMRFYFLFAFLMLCSYSLGMLMVYLQFNIVPESQTSSRPTWIIISPTQPPRPCPIISQAVVDRSVHPMPLVDPVPLQPPPTSTTSPRFRFCKENQQLDDPTIGLLEVNITRNSSDCSPGMQVVLRMLDGILMCVWPSAQDIYISSRIASGGVWDPEVMQFAIQALRGKKPGIVIDAGANIGQFTLVAAALGHIVYAFEPFQRNLDLLARSLATNSLSERVHLFKNALSDTAGVGVISVPESNRGGGNLRTLLSLVESNLAVVPLDYVIPHIEQHHPELEILFFKLDVEGYEARALVGASTLLQRFKIPYVAMEITPNAWSALECSFEDTMATLMDVGYTIETSEAGIVNADSLRSWIHSVRHLSTVDIKLYQ